jgi:hypothetical protein
MASIRPALDGPRIANSTRVLPQQSEVAFRALDGRSFEFDGDACHVEVYGIYDDGDRRWVQLALDGDRPHMLTLRIVRTTDCPDCSLVSLAVRQPAA